MLIYYECRISIEMIIILTLIWKNLFRILMTQLVETVFDKLFLIEEENDSILEGFLSVLQNY